MLKEPFFNNFPEGSEEPINLLGASSPFLLFKPVAYANTHPHSLGEFWVWRLVFDTSVRQTQVIIHQTAIEQRALQGPVGLGLGPVSMSNRAKPEHRFIGVQDKSRAHFLQGTWPSCTLTCLSDPVVESLKPNQARTATHCG